MSNIIDVSISYEKDYQIFVGRNLGEQFTGFCQERYSCDEIFILIDHHVGELHREKVKDLCQSVFKKVHYKEVPQGEQSKSVIRWKQCVDYILKEGIERGTPVLPVGGGAIGDLGGFVASTVLRGVPLIHMPTSLLAMVDSSIGGKTGVNHKTGKNLIGAFYQPDAVFAETDFLNTLAEEEWITGMAEILKYAAIRNPDLFDELEILSQQDFKPNERWTKVIRESARIKADVVQQDTLESGIREILNFGHTFAHALEYVSGYGEISHGEAVFVGMIAATHFSKKLGHPVEATIFEPFIDLYRRQIKNLTDDIDELIEIMKSDKKVKQNTIRLVLLNEWGSPYIHECTDYSMLEEAWEFALGRFN